jgi:hypothetical protein
VNEDVTVNAPEDGTFAKDPQVAGAFDTKVAAGKALQ